MRILITGGAGFLGSHLSDLLLQSGHSVICMDNLLTGSERNIQPLRSHPRFSFVRHDVTHHMQVPFKSLVRASWGLITAASFTTFGGPAPDGNNALLTWSDIYCVAPIRAMLTRCGGGPSAAMQSTATLTPIAMTPSLYANTSGLSATGNGFIFYLNGHFFLMQMAALPAAGTVWGARFYSGAVTYTAADGYGFVAATRPPAVPGLRIQAIFTGTTVDPTKPLIPDFFVPESQAPPRRSD